MTPMIALLWACQPEDVDTPADRPLVEAWDERNPLVPEHKLLPWPSDQYLVEDPATATGWRLQLAEDLLPDGLTADTFAGHDGFSRVPPIITFVPGGVDPASLPDPADWGATLDVATSPVVVLRAGDWAPVPLLVEPDATAEQDPALILRPHRALDPATRYVVIVRDAVRSPDGGPIPHSALVDALLAGEVPSGDAEAHWDVRFDLVRDALAATGIPAGEVAQAWTFTTRSEAQVIGRALALQDAAMTTPLTTWTLDEVVYEPADAPDRALIYGTLTVPRYLDDANHIALDASGAPVVHGTMEAPFLITIPATVRSTRPTVVVGHGFFSAIEEPTWGNMFDGLAQWQMSAIATKFYGFAEEDLAQAFPIFAGRLDLLATLVDQQLQSHTHFTLIHRLVEEVLADAVTVDFGDGPFHPLSGSEIPYLGASNGGTQGLVMMTTSPRIQRGGLVVAGGAWSHMLQRANQWQTLGTVLSGSYDTSGELQLVQAMTQQIFDPVDSLNYVDHLLDDRLPGREALPEILLVEAMEDSQVANLVTDWVAGNAGFPLIVPAPKAVWGLEEVTAAPPDGTDRSAFAIYDLGVPPNPPGNVAPEENGTHGAVRELPAYREQMGRFLEEGIIVQPCDGACDPG